MIDVNSFLEKFLPLLKVTFGERLWFVGLQGSYARGEATENSDIDIVVILDELTTENITAYGKLAEMLPEKDLFCGFLSGKAELFSWDTAELFQFYYDTKPIIGSLDDLLFLIDNNSIDRAIKAGACTIYHSCVHNMLYEKSYDILKSLYKSAVFVIQAVYFRQSGDYISHIADLIQAVDKEEYDILNTFINMKNCITFNFMEKSELLFKWSGRLIKED